MDEFTPIVYGAPAAISHAVTEYGVQTGFDETSWSAPARVTREQRDAWWLWALKAGIVTAAAYGVYKLVTSGRS